MDLLIVVFFLLGISVGFHIGFYLKDMRKVLQNIWERDPEPVANVVTPLPPGRADVTELSAIVTPKTPAQVEREEQERVRNL